MYDATVGRFISLDPIGFEGRDTNQYRYVGNNSVMYVDPSGLQNPDPGGWMARKFEEEECARRKARIAEIKQQMRDAMKESTANLSPEKQAEAMKELEKLFSITDGHPSMLWQRLHDCGKWAREVNEQLPVFWHMKINVQAWDSYLGVRGTDCVMGHAAIKVTIGGKDFYLDDGWWGPYFVIEDVPFYWTPYDPGPPLWMPWPSWE